MDWKFLGTWAVIFLGCLAFWLGLAVVVIGVL